MSSFTDYHKKWKEKNGRTEDAEYRQRSISEIQKSTEQYVDSVFGRRQSTIWDKIQNTAKDSLNQSNNTTTKVIDINTRNEMVKPLEDYTNAKRESMQAVSNYVQQNAKKREQEKQKKEEFIKQAKEEFRKQNPSTVNTNQKQDYELPKAEVKLTKMGDSPNLWEEITDKYEYLKREGIVGIEGGFANIQDAYATKFANAIEKGQEKPKEEAIKNSLWSLVKVISPNLGIIEDAIRDTKELLKGEKVVDKEFVKERMNQITKATDRLAGLTPFLEATENISSVLDKEESEKIKNNLLNSTQWYTKQREELDKEKQKQDELTQFIGGAVNSVGNMTPSIVASAVTKDPSVGLTIMGIGSAGANARQALNEGNSLDEAIDTGTAKAWVEVGTEKLFGGINYFGKGTFDDRFSKIVEDKISSRVGKFLAKQGYDFTGEILEENISNLAGYVIDNIVTDKEIPNIEEMLKDAGDTTASTFLTTLILKALGAPVELINKKNVMQQDDIKNLSDAQKEKLSNLLDFIENPQVEKKLVDLQQNVMNNQNNIQTGEIINEENKTAQNGNMEQISDKQQSVDYNNSNYFETVQKYNLPTDNNSIKGIYEVASKRGINVFYDDTAFTNSKQNAKWIVDSEGNRSVILNPKANTDTALQSVMIHELTHDFEGTKEYNRISSMVLERLKSSSDYDNMMLDIAKTYENEYKNMSQEQFKTMIEQEAVSDYLGENLGNQEFVNDLVKGNDRSQIQKIMDWIKNKIKSLKNTVTGKKELNYWNKIKENFERAYNKEYEGRNSSERFSIQTDNNGNQYVKVDTDQDIFDGIDKKDYNKIAKMYMQDYLKGNAVLDQKDNANIGRRGINKYTNPQQDTRFFEEKMKLTPELQNVLKIAEKVSTGNPTKETTKFPNWEYYKFDFELGGENFEGLINIGIDKEGNKHFYEINKIHNTRNIECFIETKKYYG